MAATLTRASVSVWLPPAPHGALAGIAAREGVSVALLARRAAAAAVEAPGGRVAMPAPPADAVEQLRAAGHALNRLLPAMSTACTAAQQAAGGRVAMPAPPAEAVEELRSAGYALNRLLPAMSTACTAAQQAAVAARITAALDRITAAATGVRLTPPAGPAGSEGGGGGSSGGGWRLVRVTVEPGSVEVWSAAAGAAGFRSVANWVRDGLAGLYGVAVARPPTPVTIDARAVAGRVAGLIAQTETAVADWPISAPGLDRRVEAAGDALWAALESLMAYGGDAKARR